MKSSRIGRLALGTLLAATVQACAGTAHVVRNGELIEGGDFGEQYRISYYPALVERLKDRRILLNDHNWDGYDTYEWDYGPKGGCIGESTKECKFFKGWLDDFKLQTVSNADEPHELEVHLRVIQPNSAVPTQCEENRAAVVASVYLAGRERVGPFETPYCFGSCGWAGKCRPAVSALFVATGVLLEQLLHSDELYRALEQPPTTTTEVISREVDLGPGEQAEEFTPEAVERRREEKRQARLAGNAKDKSPSVLSQLVKQAAQSTLNGSQATQNPLNNAGPSTYTPASTRSPVAAPPADDSSRKAPAASVGGAPTFTPRQEQMCDSPEFSGTEIRTSFTSEEGAAQIALQFINSACLARHGRQQPVVGARSCESREQPNLPGSQRPPQTIYSCSIQWTCPATAVPCSRMSDAPPKAIRQ